MMMMMMMMMYFKNITGCPLPSLDRIASPEFTPSFGPHIVGLVRLCGDLRNHVKLC